MNNQIHFLLQQAFNSFEQGNLGQTKLLLNNLLRIQPKNFHALHIMGVTLGIENKHKEARDFLLRAVKINPNDNYVNFNLAKALSETGNNLDSIKYHQAAIKIAPKHPEARLSFGKSLAQLRRYDEALAQYEQAIQLKPDYAEAWSNKGVTLHNLKRYDEAIAHCEKAIQLKPDHAEAWSNKGVTLHNLKRYDEALAQYEQAIQLKPDYAEAWSNKGDIFHDLQRYDEALAHYEQAIQLKPDYAEAWSNKGATFHTLKHYDEALFHYEQAIRLNPDYAEAWSNKGATFHNLQHYDQALAHYEQAIQLKPDYAEAWFKKGLTFNALKHYDEALICHDNALSLKPNIDWLSGELLTVKMQTSNWTSLTESMNEISKKLMANEKVLLPFKLLSLTDDCLLHKKSSEIYIQSGYQFNPVLGPILKRPQSQKIRVGYFSADFHNHATSYLMAEIFELHVKNKFELIGFSFGPIINDEMRQRLENSFDQFIEVGGKSDIEIAKLSRNLNIDIAIDLKVFTTDSRTGIFSYRAAPIQVNYLGYPGTMGVDYIDYIIADKTLIPLEFQSMYSEKVVYLPNSYQANDRKRLISDKIFTRQELGLPDNGFVFCCFNNNYKILPATFASWMRILNSVENSVLWLFEDNSWVAENLKKECRKQGIADNRLVFAKHLTSPEHLARHRQADLFLDTLPYNAHTTTSDALWVGLPVITLMGKSFASRVAASLIHAIGLPELIANSQDEYEALAIEMALNPQKLEKIKLKLANNRLTTPLFDTPLFTKNLEAAYIEMIDRYQEDLPPNHIYIT